MMPRYKIGDLNLLYASREKVLVSDRSECLAKFRIDTEEQLSGGVLTVNVGRFQDSALHSAPAWTEKIIGNKVLEFWQVDQNNLGLRNPHQKKYRELVFDRYFTTATLLGEDPSLLPQDLEIVLFSNWLATYGDLILHASAILTPGGVKVFCGQSGVGKSTLVDQFQGNPNVTILGEDQAILRKIGDEFFVFGTPWHINPDYCSASFGKLSAVYFLERKGINEIETMSPALAAALLIKTGFIPFYRKELVPGIIDRLTDVALSIPCFHFSYTIGSDLSILLN